MSKLSAEAKAKIQERLNRLAKINCIDAGKPTSRPTPAQQEVLDDYLAHKYKSYWVLGGNQSFPEYCRVLMADGSLKPIGQVVEGDRVVSFNMKTGQPEPSTVVKKWNNGTKLVRRYWYNNNQHLDTTDKHEMVQRLGNGGFYKRYIGEAEHVMKCSYQYEGSGGDESLAELLGFLLGDGCFNHDSAGYLKIQYSTKREEHAARVSNLLREDHKLAKYCSNGDYFIVSKEGGKGNNFYINWIKELGLDRTKAHSKFIPEVCFSWSLKARAALLRGLLATDGWISPDRVGYCTVSERLWKDVNRLFLSLGVIPTLKRKVHKKKTHRDELTVQVTRGHMIQHLQQLIGTVSAKPWHPIKKSRASELYSWTTQKIERMEVLGEMEVYDLTVDNPSHTFICEGIAVGNSGKTALLRKVAAWFLAEGEPDIPWKRKENWEGPLQCLLISKSHKQLTESVLPGILKFFGEDEIKIVKNANYVEKILHKKTGNTIICAVHENPSQARERVQSFTLHLVLLDELPAGPSAYKLIEELEARVMILKGCLFASFTPKSINKAVKDHVENMNPPVGKRYSLRFVDNPAADAEVIEARLQQISHLPDHMQKTLLEGTWATAESTVYTLTDYAIQSPLHYSPLWRHTLGIDPGLASKQGFVVLAEDPASGRWYVIHAEAQDKIEDVDDGVRRIADYITRTQINVTKIVYDSAGTYWFMAARKHPVLKQYTIDKPFHKNSESRWQDMVSTIQTSLGATLFIAPWNEGLIEEFGSYAWNDSGKIIKAQKYHMLDALR